MHTRQCGIPRAFLVRMSELHPAFPLLQRRPPQREHSRLQRRIGVRQKTDLAVILHDGFVPTSCRAVELSATGMVVERSRPLDPTEQQRPVGVQIFLPNSTRPIALVARTARMIGNLQALRFAIVNDADRLSLMEHLDRELAGDPVPR